MSKFFGVSSGFVPVIIGTMALTLFFYLLYMVYCHISSYAVKRELFELGDKYREWFKGINCSVFVYGCFNSYSRFLFSNVQGKHLCLVYICSSSCNGWYCIYEWVLQELIVMESHLLLC